MTISNASKWGGYGASAFTIVCFCEGLAYAVTEGDLPDWFAILTGSSFLLATLSGVVCLLAALLAGFQRKRSKGGAGGGNEVMGPVRP